MYQLCLPLSFFPRDLLQILFSIDLKGIGWRNIGQINPEVATLLCASCACCLLK